MRSMYKLGNIVQLMRAGDILLLCKVGYSKSIK